MYYISDVYVCIMCIKEKFVGLCELGKNRHITSIIKCIPIVLLYYIHVSITYTLGLLSGKIPSGRQITDWTVFCRPDGKRPHEWANAHIKLATGKHRNRY